MSDLRILGLVLDPLDVLFFRDGRPFGPSIRAGGGLPMPQTVAGAITTALLARHGCDFHKLGQLVRSGADWAEAVVQTCGAAQRWIADLRLRGPWLSRRLLTNGPDAVAPPELLLPAPANLHAPKKGAAGILETLAPLAAEKTLPGWSESGATHGLRPLWKRGSQPTAGAQGFLTEAGIRAFLGGQQATAEQLLRPELLFQYDQRTGIEIDADQLTARESQIYGARFLSLARDATFDDAPRQRWDVVFCAEAVLPPEAPLDALVGVSTVAWGGEGRRAALAVIPPFDWRKLESAPSAGKKPFVLLTTPGLFADDWRPACLADALVAAAVPERVPVSGWDLARGGPKPTRFAVSSGSVYFLNHLPECPPFALSDHDPDRRQGWGCYLQGVWTDA